MKKKYNKIYKDLVDKIYNLELNNKNIFIENNEKVPYFYFNEEKNILTIIFHEDNIDTKKSLNDFYKNIQNTNYLSEKVHEIKIKVKEDFKKNILNRYIDLISTKNNTKRNFKTSKITRATSF